MTQQAEVRHLQFYNLDKPIPKQELSSSVPLICYGKHTPHDECIIDITSSLNVTMVVNTNGLYLDKITMSIRHCNGLGISVMQDDTIIYSHIFSPCPQQELVVFELQEATRHHFPISIIDVTLFNGEYTMALYRIKYLFDVIDEFVIIESRYPFSSSSPSDRKAQLYFYNATFQSSIAQYLSKITFIEVSNWPQQQHIEGQEGGEGGYKKHPWMSAESVTAFARENFQRQTAKGLIRQRMIESHGRPHNEQPERAQHTYPPYKKYLLICADVDEIPNRHVIRQLRDESLYNTFHTPVYLQMVHFMYNFHWYAEHYWERAYIVTAEGYLRINDTLLARVPTMMLSPSGEYVKKPNEQHHTIARAGWHFCNFCSIAELRRKIESFAHTEKNLPAFKEVSYVATKIKEGLDLYNRSFIVHRRVTEMDDFDLPEGWEELHSDVTAQQL